MSWLYSDEELRADGSWSEADIAAYRAAVNREDAKLEAARRETSFSAFSAPAAAVSAPPAPGTAEHRSYTLARELMAVSDAKDAVARAARAREVAEGVQAAAVERPGTEPSVSELRQWALKQARMSRPPTLRPDGAPVHNVVQSLPDGSVRIVRQSALSVPVLVRPEDWPQHEQAWAVQQRQAENELLLAVYGREECERSGILDA